MSNLTNSKYFLRTTGGTFPTLGFAQSFWALSQRRVPIVKALEEVCSDGFEYFEVGLREERLAETQKLLQKFPLKLIAQGWATSANDAIVYFERAAQFHAVALNLHLGHAYLATDEAVDLVGDVQRKADAYGIPLLLETHRGRMTQDLFRTKELLDHLPGIVFALDLSHYVVAGETLGGSEDLFRAHVKSILSRTALIHGRVSNGQSIQVSTEDHFAFTSIIQSLWQQAMELWLSDAPSDAVFIFEPELGPPPYAYLASDGSETFDRVDESHILTRLAQEAWKAAQERLRSPRNAKHES